MSLTKIHFSDPVYLSEIYLLVGRGQDLDRWFHKQGAEEITFENKGGLFTFNENWDYLICLNTELIHSTINEVLEHECLHLCLQIFNHCGIKLSDDSEEAFTYYYSYILKVLKEKLNARKKSIPTTSFRARRTQPRRVTREKQIIGKIKQKRIKGVCRNSQQSTSRSCGINKRKKRQ